MATVANPPTYRQVFFAQLDGLSGTLAKLDDGLVYFFHEASGDLRPVDSYKGLVVLGEVGLAMAQYVLDDMHGGAARICTSRQMEAA
jgi:hypothetical protein